MDRIRVAMTGVLGRMGREVLAAVSRQPDMEAVGGVARQAEVDRLALPQEGSIPIATDLSALIESVKPDIIVDFSHASATIEFARIALSRGTAMVIGTSGLAEGDLEEIRQLSLEHEIGVVVGPNFGLGGVLMTHVCRIVAPFFEYAEVIEMHREGKADAPSGTAIATARAMLEARDNRSFSHNVAQRETVAGTRGGELGGVAIHSVRSPGVVGAHEVIFGGAGESLTVRHDSLTRESFMPGVLMAVRAAVKERRYIYGLESLIGLAG